MPEIVVPQIVVFANEKCRPMADVSGSLYQTAKRFQQEWAALVADGVVIPNTADLVADGSAVDGRKRITGAQVNGLKALADAMVTWFETGTPTRIAQLQQVTVNEQARF